MLSESCDARLCTWSIVKDQTEVGLMICRHSFFFHRSPLHLMWFGKVLPWHYPGTCPEFACGARCNQDWKRCALKLAVKLAAGPTSCGSHGIPPTVMETCHFEGIE